MNITPIMITEDSNPTASTACGMLGFTPAGTGNDWPGSTLPSVAMIERPVLKAIVEVPINTASDTLIKRFDKVLPFGKDFEWRICPISCYQYVNGQINFKFQAMCTAEVKGIFAFHIWDYPTQHDETTSVRDLHMRNRTEFWNLEEDGPEFTLTINPTSRFGTKKRFNPRQDHETDLSDLDVTANVLFYTPNSGGTTDPALWQKFTNFPQHSEIDLNEGATIEMYLHSKLQSTINLPDVLEINIWNSYTNLGLSFPKSYPECDTDVGTSY
ncbi:MAG: hypothetical protein GuPV1_gp3 [Guiyang polycipivirus 1]|nr:MAG: hypothetical protein GuPV1_gp3 [Guiyang polycipivirus 1]